MKIFYFFLTIKKIYHRNTGLHGVEYFHMKNSVFLRETPVRLDYSMNFMYDEDI
jgi:hypothetical protein